MDIQSVYRSFEFRLNKAGSNAGQNISLPHFVDCINKAQLQWVEVRARAAERDGIIADELQQLLKEFTKQGVHKKDKYELPLPEDYFHLVRATSTTDCGSLYIHRVEEGNINTLVSDSYAKPSKEWEEALGTVSGGKFMVYTSDFTIGDISMTYYRYPVYVDIEGYSKGGNPSANIDLEFNGSSAQEIIDLAALIAASDTGDQARYQTLTQIVQSNP